MRIGLISDTHGLLRPEALAALAGCDHLVHAGDIGKSQILEFLSQIAPLTVVRGNNDTAAWAVSHVGGHGREALGACSADADRGHGRSYVKHEPRATKKVPASRPVGEGDRQTLAGGH